MVRPINGHKRKFSKYIHIYLQPYMKELNCMSKTLFGKSTAWKKWLTTTAFLLTWTYVPYRQKFQARKELQLWKQPWKEKIVGTRIITTLLKLVLTSNHFVFNCQIYQQIKGCAMSKKFAPSYLNIFMDIFEGRHLYPLI